MGSCSKWKALPKNGSHFGAGHGNHSQKSMSDFCVVPTFNCHLHKQCPSAAPWQERSFLSKTRSSHAQVDKSLTVWGKPSPLHRDKRYRQSKAAMLKFVNSLREKEQTKDLLWASVRARFWARSGAAVKCLFQQHSLSFRAASPRNRVKDCDVY